MLLAGETRNRKRGKERYNLPGRARRKITNRQRAIRGKSSVAGSKDRLNSSGSLAGTKDILRDAFNADSRLP
jgi:hypothetical protein